MKKQLSDGFKRSVYWSSYQTIPSKILNQGTNICELLSALFQGVKRSFVLAYFIVSDVANNGAGIKNSRYFLPRRKIENYIVSIDGRNFYD